MQSTSQSTDAEPHFASLPLTNLTLDIRMVAQAGTKFGSKCTPRWWLNDIDAKASHRFVLRSMLICELAIVHAAKQLLGSGPTSAEPL